MNLLYQKNNLILRRATQPDCKRFVFVLRWEDRAELASSHPGQKVESLLIDFWKSSRWCFILQWWGEPVALWGLAPDVWLGRRACVWLLTGRNLPKAAKTFVRLSRGLLAAALTQYDELYNFTDGRYTAALGFVRRLGGRFDGCVYHTPCAPFLRFTFRRK